MVVAALLMSSPVPWTLGLMQYLLRKWCWHLLSAIESRLRETFSGTFQKLLGGTLVEFRGMLVLPPPQRARDSTKLGEPLPRQNLERICPRRVRILGGTSWGTLAEHWWNLLRNLSAAQDGSAPEDYRNTTRFGEPWWNLGGMLVDPWRNLGGTFRGTFWRPETDLPPQRTIKSPKAILPRNLCYG